MTALDIENVTQQLKNLGKCPTNWNDLPSEMKRLCIKEMDFKTRTGLRCSSKTERKLVDSVKLVLNIVRLELFPKSSTFEVDVNDKDEWFKCYFGDEDKDDEAELRTKDLSEDVGQFSKVTEFLKQVLTAEIKYFELHIDSDGRDNKDRKLIAEMIATLPVLSVKKLDFKTGSPNELGIDILKHCDGNKLTDIIINNVNFLEASFFTIQQVINAERLELADYDGSEPVLRKKVEMWLKCFEMYADFPAVGKNFNVTKFPDAIEVFMMEKLGESIIRRHPTIQAVRFPTSENALHIWIYLSSRDSHLQMFIVASDAEDPDFQQMDYERIDKPVQDFNRQVLDFIAAPNFGAIMQEIAEQIGPADPEDFDVGDYEDMYY